MKTLKQRTMEKVLLQASRDFPIILVTGPRQVGKSTLLQMAARKSPRRHVSLDDFTELQQAQDDPEFFLEKHGWPLTIDAIQYAPQLLSRMKMIVDREKKPGLFWLTGSQKFETMKGVKESLAGRVAILDLLGFSRAELEARSNEPFFPSPSWLAKARKKRMRPSASAIYKRIWQGSFPQIHASANLNRNLFYSSYVRTYIERDVRSMIHKTSEVNFSRFLGVVASRTGSLLNYADMARDADADEKTVKFWLSILKSSGLIYLLYPYYKNLTKRLVKKPKLYFLDTGLCSYLTRWPDPASLAAGNMSGAILETYIFSEILKSWWHCGEAEVFYYYRDNDQKEIDLLIHKGGKLYPVEFKKSTNPSPKSFSHFKLLNKVEERGHGAIVCLRQEDTPLSRDTDAIPVAYL